MKRWDQVYRKGKVISVLMAASLAMSTAACAAPAAAAGIVQPGETADDKALSDDSADALLQEKIAGETGIVSNESGKSETVYVIADASGKQQKIIVSDHLRNPEKKKVISDSSILQDIRNTNGYEEYTKGEGQELSWNAEGRDIFYQGKTDRALPVEVKVSYQLDGEEITPEELAGKSGHVTIRFDYVNHEQRKIHVRGKEENVYVPFGIISGALLPSEHFSNIEVVNGKAVTEGMNTIVVGMAFPGLQESLRTEGRLKEQLEDLNIPSYVEIRADVKDFELDMTMTVVSADLFGDMADLREPDTKELSAQMSDLQEGMDQLLDGAEDLKNGTEELRDGAGKLSDGSGRLEDGTRKLKNGTGELRSGTKELADGAGSLKNGSWQLAEGTVKLRDGSRALEEGNRALRDGTGQLYEKIHQTGTALTAKAPVLITKVYEAKRQLDMLDAAFTSVSKNSSGDAVPGILPSLQALIRTSGELRGPASEVSGKAADGTDLYSMMVMMQKVAMALQSSDLTVTETKQTLQKTQQALYFKLYGNGTEENPSAGSLKAGLLAAKSNFEAYQKGLNDAVNGAQEASASSAVMEEGEKEKLSAAETEKPEEASAEKAATAVAGSENAASAESAVPEPAETDPKQERTGTEEKDSSVPATEQPAVETGADAAADTSADVPVSSSMEKSSDAVQTDSAESPDSDKEAAGTVSSENTVQEESGTETGAEHENAHARRGFSLASGNRKWRAHGRTQKKDDALQSALQAYQEAQASYMAAQSAYDTVKGQYDQLTQTLSGLSAMIPPEAPLAENSVRDYAARTAAGLQEQYIRADALNKGLSQLYDGLETVEQMIAGTVQQTDEQIETLQPKLKEAENQFNMLDQGVKSLYDGSVKAADGSVQLADAAGQLKDGAEELRNGAGKLSEGAGKLDDGVRKLDNGTAELLKNMEKFSEGAEDLYDGSVKLDDGAAELLDGMRRFNEEGISELTKMLGEDLGTVLDRLREIRQIGADYNNFAGAREDSHNSVRFIYKTEAIKAERAD